MATVHLIIYSMDLMCTNSKFTVPSGGNIALFTIEDTVSTLNCYRHHEYRLSYIYLSEILGLETTIKGKVCCDY